MRGRLRHFLAQWEHQGAHRSILSLLRDGYKLPFREHPNLSRVPSGYAGSDRKSALLTSIQDLLHKGAIEVVHTQNSLGFYSRLFLVPKPGNRWRPVIDLSSLNKFLAIPKFKMKTPESIRASLRKGEWVTVRSVRSHGCIPACTYPYPLSKISQVPPQWRHLPVCQSTLWSGYSSSSFHQPCQGGKTTGTTTRNQNQGIVVHLF